MADQEERQQDERETAAAAGTAVLEEEQAKPASPGIDEETRRRRAAALAQIVQYGDPVLKSRASDVDAFDDALRTEVDRMVGLMKDGLGVGLAANQVGRLKRLLVFQPNADSEPQALVNPEIEWVSEETEAMVEGCLSIPRVVVEVERPLHARVSGRDQTGEPVMIEASGYEARILQHEIDHLNGILILDRTDRSERRAALKALRRGESYPPPPAEEEAETAA
jgi:peptide deformylase